MLDLPSLKAWLFAMAFVRDICLDPDRWALDFYCLEDYGELLWLCWPSVWDEFTEQPYIPPRVTASLFVLSRRLTFSRFVAVKTDDATFGGLEGMVRL